MAFFETCSTLCSNQMTLHHEVARLAEGCGLPVHLSDEILITSPLPTDLARPPPSAPLLLLHPASDCIVSGECITQLAPYASVAAEVRERLGESLALPSLIIPIRRLRWAGQQLGCCCCSSSSLRASSGSNL